MKVERRVRKAKGSIVVDAVFVSETEEESAILDDVFGNTVESPDGMIGASTCECRLSNGYMEHYVYVKGKIVASCKKLVEE